VPAGVAALSIPKSALNDENTGDLNITGNVVIRGDGPATTAIDGNGAITGTASYA
jgi:hypothetical protein